MNIKKHIVATGIILILLVVCFSGCEELEKLDKPDYITVTVNCQVDVFINYGWDDQIGILDKPAKDVLVKVEIIKAGGERVSELRTTSANGVAPEVIGTLKLYREQPITCIANVVLTSVEQYPEYTFDSDSFTIPWNDIYSKYDFGDSVTKDVYLSIHGREES